MKSLKKPQHKIGDPLIKSLKTKIKNPLQAFENGQRSHEQPYNV